MADEPEKIEEITVRVEDAGDAGASKVNEGDAAADPVAELKAQYDELQAQQKRDQEARQAAEVRARTAESARAQADEEARTARTEATDTRLSSIDAAIEAAKSAADAASSEYTAALEVGDWSKASKAQRKLARAEAESVQYEQNKAAWEAHKAQPAPQRQQPVGDQIEAYINRIAVETPNSANWLRNHRDWITDPQKSRKLTWAHHDAVTGAGLQIDSPEYFKHIERKIGLTQEEPPNGNGADKTVAVSSHRRSAPAPVAPVTASPGGTSGGGVEVRLSKNEAQAAQDGTLVWNYPDPTGQNRWKKGDPIGLQEMARRKKAMQEAGMYDKGNIEA